MTPSEQTQPLTLTFADDGRIPNSPRLAPALDRAAFVIEGVTHPERLLVDTFTRNHWGDVWQNGIYPYAHDHSTTREALGVARGLAKVRFEGARGEEVGLAAGDVACCPPARVIDASGKPGFAGGRRLSRLRYDLCRGSKEEQPEPWLRSRTFQCRNRLRRASPLINLWRRQ
jgi:hypothetical protein